MWRCRVGAPSDYGTLSLYPMDFEWTDAVHLDDVALRDGEVMHPFGQDDVRNRQAYHGTRVRRACHPFRRTTHRRGR
jgi:hypothetical protein